MSHVFKLQINVSRSAGRKRAGFLQLTLGKIRRPPALLDPRTAPAPPRDRPAFWLRLGLSLSAELRGRVRLGGRGASSVPLAAQPHLRFSSCTGPRGRTRQPVWQPSRISGLSQTCEGLPGARGCLVPTKKGRKEPSPNAMPLPRAGRRDGSAGRANAARGGVSRSTGPTRRDQVEQPAWRKTPPLAGRGRGASSLTDWWTEGAYHRRLPPPEQFAGFHSLVPEQPLDLHLLWRENNPLLPLIGFVVEVWDWVPLFVFPFSLPFNCDHPAPIPKEEEGR
ncbi:uncharacterized protein LOC130684293 [Manis pentadactyla]|uniref:uncharacterized protein LOC130684293 n=1 Tax=Manis pentadactyla TaxID=143292 RepID=UPI00255C8484|nr:uncharacterized protein LOC130684293 [Manis pentadactyla]